MGCRFVILSNGHRHYLWDIQSGNPVLIKALPSQEQLINKKENFQPKKELFKKETIEENYVALTQYPDYKTAPEYVDELSREDFKLKNKLRFFRPMINYVNLLAYKEYYVMKWRLDTS